MPAPRPELTDALFAGLRADRARRDKAADTSASKAAALRRSLMPHQAELEADPSRRKAVRSARRAGKSEGAIRIVTIHCVEHPGARWVVVGLTRPSIKEIYWSTLKGLNESFGLGARFQHQELTVEFPNGSRIRFMGADNVGEIEKLRGGNYDGVVIDECKSFGPVLFRELVEEVIEPALLDRVGLLLIIGTPGTELRGPFYLATCVPGVVEEAPDGSRRLSNRLHTVPDDPRCPAVWSLHLWTQAMNTTPVVDPVTGAVSTLWAESLKIKARRGWTDDNPTWLLEYKGEWVAEDRRVVYRYRPHLHDYLPDPNRENPWGIPAPNGTEFRRVIGFDFGTRDGTAFVVWAFSPTFPGLWELYSDKKTADPGQKLTVGMIASWYRDIENKYGPFEGWPADPAGLATMVIDTLGAEHGVNLEVAEKREKYDHIVLFNSDLDNGLIHVLRGSQLAEELLGDRWLEKTLGTDKRKEDPATPNDTADAGLYAFRWARHREARPNDPPGAAPYTREWIENRAALELAQAIAKARSARDPDRLDRNWWSDDGGHDPFKYIAEKEELWSHQPNSTSSW